MTPPPLPRRPGVRVATEAVAALLWPLHATLVMLLPALPLTAVVVADLERARARECGEDVVPHHETAGSWRAWLGHRIRTSHLWTRDVPITLASLVLGLVSLVVGAVGALGGIVMMLAPLLLALGMHTSIGPWTVDSSVRAWLMVPVGGVLLVITAAVLVVVSLCRDAVVQAIGKDEAERLSHELGIIRSSRTSIVEAFEAERRRIERDLHDGVQQDLVALTMTLGLVEHSATELDGEQAERLRELAGRARDQADRSLVRLRETVHGIHPRELTDHGLVAAVHELATRSPLRVQVDAVGDDSTTPSPVAGALYFVVTEALTNVSRHAQVTQARVEVVVDDHEVVVRVTDTGVGGADLPDAAASGTGLAGLRERVRGLGGDLSVRSQPGSGTTVSAHVPLHDDEAG